MDDAVTRATLGELRETPIDVGIGETPKSFTEAEIDEGEQAVAKGTDTRVQVSKRERSEQPRMRYTRAS